MFKQMKELELMLDTSCRDHFARIEKDSMVVAEEMGRVIAEIEGVLSDDGGPNIAVDFASGGT